MDAVAVMTDGDIFDLRPGKNGIFYDLQGNNWDAVITKVVDNPVSISQAFWAPYRKAWEFCVGIINKSAADKDARSMLTCRPRSRLPQPRPQALPMLPSQTSNRLST
mgnify:CR=1 FL=1